MINDEILLG